MFAEGDEESIRVEHEELTNNLPNLLLIVIIVAVVIVTVIWVVIFVNVIVGVVIVVAIIGVVVGGGGVPSIIDLSFVIIVDSEIEDNVVEEEDGEWICFLGGNSSSGTKKYRGSNSNDGGNTGDGVKIAVEYIGSGDENSVIP
ncbi:hypothetical protein Tco_0355877 [Tanacetum coccineum]